MKKILLVEDDKDFAFECIEVLLKNKYDVEYAINSEVAKVKLLENDIDIAIIDLMLPPSYSKEGLFLADYITKRCSRIDLLLMTSKERNTIEIVAEAMKKGTKFFLDKNTDFFFDKLIFHLKDLDKKCIKWSNPLENVIKAQIATLKENAFQEFIEKLYSIYYGNGFTILKQKRDKGCDGIIMAKTVISVYAPERHSINKFKKKIKNEDPKNKGDFDKYASYWQNQYPGWQIVYNHDFTGEMIKFVTKLKNDAEFIGLQNIVEMISWLDNEKKEIIVNFLKIPDYFWQAFI